MGWTDPRVIDHLIPAHDKYSDWYCLALAMYRGLLLTSGKLDSKRPDGSWPEPKAIPADLDPESPRCCDAGSVTRWIPTSGRGPPSG